MQFSSEASPDSAYISHGLKSHHTRNGFIEALLNLDVSEDKTLYEDIFDEFLKAYNMMDSKSKVDWVLEIMNRFAPKSKEAPDRERKYQLVLTKDDEF